MDNQTINTFLKKKNEDSADDSFDFFLPNKLREKPKLMHRAGNPRRNNTLTKRKQNSSSSSSSSQETCDTEMERILDICLTKDSNTRINTGTKRSDSISDWNKIKGKMNRQPLLMTRTAEEREAILSQKLALILLSNGLDDDKYSKIDTDSLVNSDLLLQQYCKACRLWSAAREPFMKTNEFYLVNFSKYIEITERSFESINLPVNNELIPLKSPTSQHEVIVNNSDLDIFECDDRVEEKSPCVNVSSPENLDDHLIHQQTSAVISTETSLCFSPYNLTSKTIPNKTEVLINISSSSSSPSLPPCSNYMKKSPSAYYVSEDSQKTLSPCKISIDEEVEQIRMLDRMGVALLAEQWGDLFNTDNGDTTVLLSLGATLKVHKFVLTVRCQSLVSEITDDYKLEWSVYTLEAAKAFFSFRYVYTGKCDHLWHLDFLDKITLKLLSRLYKLSHLEEVLIKFHNLRPSSQSKIVKGINQSVGRKLEECSAQIHSTLTKIDVTSDDARSEEELFTPVDRDKIKKPSEDSKDCSLSPRFKSSPNFLENLSYPEISPENYEPVKKKRSLEKYFQDSFPDLISSYGDINSADVNSNVDFKRTSHHDISASTLKDEVFVHSPIIESVSITTSPIQQDEKLEYHLSSPSLETLSDRSSKSSTMSFSSHENQHSLTPENVNIPLTQSITPSTSSGIIFSKNATPFPDYDSMMTPQIKRELKKYGLRSDLGANKAKMLLKYIYEQTHPIVESEETIPSQVTITTNRANEETLKEIISRLIKQNRVLYSHILLFRPIWFEDFYELLKDNGIICSKNELKDTLNNLCVTYRTKNVGSTNLKKKSRKRQKYDSTHKVI